MFKAIRQSFGNLKLRTKIFLLILFSASLPMIILASVLSGRLYQMITSDTIRQEQASASQAAPLLDETLGDITTFSDLIGSYTFSRRLFDLNMTEPVEDLIHSEAASGFEMRVRNGMEKYGASGVRIYIDLPKSDVVFSELDEDSIFASMDWVRTTYWYGIFYSTHPTQLFCPPFYLGSREENNLGDCAYIRPVRIHDEKGNYIRCYLAVYFQSEDLKAILTEHQTQQGSVSYISNERDAMITTTDQALSGIYYMDYDKIRNKLMSSNGLLETEVLNERIYVGCNLLPRANWYLVTVTPSSPLMEKTTQTWWQIINVWFLSALITILLAVFLSHTITRRITAVSHQMNKVKNGLPIPMASPEETDEIGELVDSYNYMARQIDNLVAQQQKSAEELRVSEFNSLQAQINPHFLYNTMEMINWMAQQGRIKETNQAIRDLSAFYKLTLSRKESISTVEEEIEHVSIYARLQNMRFDDGIDFVVDVPDSLLDYRIPKLTLQPVVENAILHGILEKESHRGTIVLTGWLDGSDVVLLLSDDGVGIAADKLPLLLTGKMPSTGKGTHIAIVNTHRRLQILYGQSYGLHYESTEGQGTEVEIRFPAYTEVDPLGSFGSDRQLPIPIVSGNNPTAILPPGKQKKDSAAGLVQLNGTLARDRFQIRALHSIFRVLPENQSFYIVSHLVNDYFPTHEHDYFELNYLCSGTLKNIVDGHEIRMSPGSICLMNKKASHAMDYIGEEALVINICFNDTYVEEVLGAVADRADRLGSFLGERSPMTSNHLFYPFGRIATLQAMISDIIQIYADNDYHTSQALDVAVYKFFIALAECKAETDELSYERELV